MSLKEFCEQYEEKEREMLVLMDDSATKGRGASTIASGDCWIARTSFWACLDLESGKVNKEAGQLHWPVTNEENANKDYAKRFQAATIYKIKARKVLPDPEEKSTFKPYLNRYYVTEVLEADVSNEALEAVLKKYQKDVVLKDDLLGKLIQDRKFGYFVGKAHWLDRNIEVLLDVNKDDKESWNQALAAMRSFFTEQEKWDKEMRKYAAEELTELANEWLEDEEETQDCLEITEEEFAKRIIIYSVSMDDEGKFRACFEDDNMFAGHTVVVYGSVEEGLDRANMEG